MSSMAPSNSSETVKSVAPYSVNRAFAMLWSSLVSSEKTQAGEPFRPRGSGYDTRADIGM